MLNFAWTHSVCRWSLLLLLLYVRIKNWVNVKSMCFVKFSIISRVVKFYAKLSKTYLNALTCNAKFIVFYRRNSETFDILHAFFPINRRKVTNLKTVRFFTPPCTCTSHQLANQSKSSLDYNSFEFCGSLSRVITHTQFLHWHSEYTTDQRQAVLGPVFPQQINLPLI